VAACRRRAALALQAAAFSIVLAFAAPYLHAESIHITAADLGLEPIVAPLRTDTVLHGIAGAMAALLAASAGASLYPQATVERYPLLLPSLGLSAAVAAGIAKETLDSTGFGDPQWGDLIHTLIGGLAGAGFIALIERNPGRGPGVGTNHTGLYAGIGVTLSVPIAAGMLQEVGIFLAKRRLKK